MQSKNLGEGEVYTMVDRCAALINEVLFKKHSDSEWKALYQQYLAIVDTSTQKELEQLEESGIGEILYMICS
jgi:hypothetical protein